MFKEFLLKAKLRESDSVLFMGVPPDFSFHDFKKETGFLNLIFIFLVCLKEEILKVSPINKLGRPLEIMKLLGGAVGYKKMIKEIETRLYKS